MTSSHHHTSEATAVQASTRGKDINDSGVPGGEAHLSCGLGHLKAHNIQQRLPLAGLLLHIGHPFACMLSEPCPLSCSCGLAQQVPRPSCGRKQQIRAAMRTHGHAWSSRLLCNIHGAQAMLRAHQAHQTDKVEFRWKLHSQLLPAKPQST